MRGLWVVGPFALLSVTAARAQSPIVLAAEAHQDRFTLMNLGPDPVVYEFLPMPASVVDHSVLGSTYTVGPTGYHNFGVPQEVAASPVSFRMHQLRSDGLRCAGEATDLFPLSATVRGIVVRDNGRSLRKTVLDATWDCEKGVSYAVPCNEMSGEPFALVLTDGVASKTITVSGSEVDPGSFLIVVGPPPLLEPTDGILDPYFQPPGVDPHLTPWVDTKTGATPF